MELTGDGKKNGRKDFLLNKIDDKIILGSYDLHVQKEENAGLCFEQESLSSQIRLCIKITSHYRRSYSGHHPHLSLL